MITASLIVALSRVSTLYSDPDDDLVEPTAHLARPAESVLFVDSDCPDFQAASLAPKVGNAHSLTGSLESVTGSASRISPL